MLNVPNYVKESSVAMDILGHPGDLGARFGDFTVNSLAFFQNLRLLFYWGGERRFVFLPLSSQMGHLVRTQFSSVFGRWEVFRGSV